MKNGGGAGSKKKVRPQTSLEEVGLNQYGEKHFAIFHLRYYRLNRKIYISDVEIFNKEVYDKFCKKYGYTTFVKTYVTSHTMLRIFDAGGWVKVLEFGGGKPPIDVTMDYLIRSFNKLFLTCGLRKEQFYKVYKILKESSVISVDEIMENKRMGFIVEGAKSFTNIMREESEIEERKKEKKTEEREARFITRTEGDINLPHGIQDREKRI